MKNCKFKKTSSFFLLISIITVDPSMTARILNFTFSTFFKKANDYLKWCFIFCLTGNENTLFISENQFFGNLF